MGAISVNGNLTINASANFSASTFTHTILGDWTNNGTFIAGSSTIQFSGDDDANIRGATTFNNVTINNTSNSNVIHLWANISAANIAMTIGSVNTEASTLTITNSRTGNGIILGTIKRQHSFTTGIAYEFESPYNSILFTGISGVSSVTVKVTPGPVSDFPFGGSINRAYEITVPAGTYTANLRLHYENSELNGNSETGIVNWNNTGSSWLIAGKSSNDTALNYIQLDALTNIGGRWTCAEDNHVVRWNGNVSSDWSNPSNWTAVQGTPSRPPSLNDIVQIGYINYVNAPVITTAANAKNISFGSAKVSTLSLSTGGSLTIQGNISGSWSATAAHTLNVNGQTLTVNGDVNMSDGTSGRQININIGTGTLAINGSLTQSGLASLIFTAAGNLSIGQNYTYTNGTFTRSTGTVTYNGTGSQIIAPVNYQHLTINKNAGIATLSTAATISGNLTVTKGEIDINGTSTISGNVNYSAGSLLKSAAITLTVGGNWSNSGTFTSGGGTVTFNGSLAQTISASPFNTLTINKSGNTATVTGNLVISSNLTVTAGTLDLGVYTANRAASGGTLTISSGANLLVGGANNFPANFTTNTINSNSTVTFNGTMVQTMPVKTYGNLVFSNGTSNAKTLTGNTTANGNITVNSGSTLACSTFIFTIGGNWTNSGTFTAGTGTVKLTGAAKTITGYTAFNQLTISGNYTNTGTDILAGNTFSILTGGIYNAGSGVFTMSGDFHE